MLPIETQAKLAQAGHQTVIASTQSGVCPGARGGQATAEVSLTQVNCADYAAVVFVGGSGSKLLYVRNPALMLGGRQGRRPRFAVPGGISRLAGRLLGQGLTLRQADGCAGGACATAGCARRSCTLHAPSGSQTTRVSRSTEGE